MVEILLCALKDRSPRVEAEVWSVRSSVGDAAGLGQFSPRGHEDAQDQLSAGGVDALDRGVDVHAVGRRAARRVHGVQGLAFAELEPRTQGDGCHDQEAGQRGRKEAVAAPLGAAGVGGRECLRSWARHALP